MVISNIQEELVRSATFKYITDVLTPAEALEMLKATESGKKEREKKVREVGYPAYVTSAGWLGAFHPLHIHFDVSNEHHFILRLFGRKNITPY